MIDQLIDDLKSDEGWRERPYRCSEGWLTTGYGFLIDERRSIPMPREVGDLWLRLIVADRFAELTARLPWLMDQPADVQRALGNMAYQMGVSGVMGFRKMLAALKDGDRELAANESLDSTWAKQTPRRAQRVAALIRG